METGETPKVWWVCLRAALPPLTSCQTKCALQWIDSWPQELQSMQNAERDADGGGRGRQLRGGLEEDARRSLIQMCGERLGTSCRLSHNMPAVSADAVLTCTAAHAHGEHRA